MLTVLQVAYPLARVGEDASGGAEVVLSALDRAVLNSGHRSLVLASSELSVAGELIPVRSFSGTLDEANVSLARQQHSRALRAVLAKTNIDLVHMHGLDFDHYLPEQGPPVLATLHCPVGWYRPQALRSERPLTWLNAVSEWQHRQLPPVANLLPPIENGVAFPEFSPKRRSSYALMLSRIAPEKGVHVALEASHIAGLPLIIAGQVFGYPEHQHYYARQVAPLLDPVRRFIGHVAGERKRRLIAGARCVVVPSLCEETSCLVAREALSAGTPVVAFPSGALTDIVEHGSTGFLVPDTQSMAKAMVDSVRLDPAQCRASAVQRFSLEAMTRQYLRLYADLAGRAQ